MSADGSQGSRGGGQGKDRKGLGQAGVRKWVSPEFLTVLRNRPELPCGAVGVQSGGGTWPESGGHIRALLSMAWSGPGKEKDQVKV